MFEVMNRYDGGIPERVLNVRYTDDGETFFLMFQYGEWVWNNARDYVLVH